MLTAKQAVEVRAQHDSAYAHLTSLKATKPVKPSRSETILWNKEIKKAEELLADLNAQLKDAPPPPMNPDEAWIHIVDVFQRFDKDADEAKAKFVEEAQRSLHYATQWYIADAIKAETQAKKMVWFTRLNAQEDLTVEQKLEKFIEMYPEFINQLKEDVLRRARGMTSRSTSTASNFADDCEAEGIGYLLYEFTESTARWQVRRAVDRYNVWKELQNN